MAKQTGMYIVGRRAHLIYYQWKGGYYLRTKSSLSGERVRKDPAFAKSRVRAREFGVAWKLATEIFHLLPQEAKKRGVMGGLTGKAHTWLLAGHSLSVVREVLLEWVEQLIPKTVVRKYRRQISGEKSPGLMRQQQWVGENKQPVQQAVTTIGALSYVEKDKELKPPPKNTDRAAQPDD